jgi:hypothetical protein
MAQACSLELLPGRRAAAGTVPDDADDGQPHPVVAVMSYNGQLNITTAADMAGCPDLEVFTTGTRSAIDELARSVRAPAVDSHR